MGKQASFYQQNLLNPKGHETCRHYEYVMSCQAFEMLQTRSGGMCEICRMPGYMNMHRKLFIDHDYRLGFWAVRGLLCSQCNMDLGKYRAEGAARAFLDNPFYLTILKAYGSPVEMDEPPFGSRLTDRQGGCWVRMEKRWRTRSARVTRGGGYDYTDWWPLYRDNGPHILRQKLVLPKERDTTTALAAKLRASMSPDQLAELVQLIAPDRPN